MSQAEQISLEKVSLRTVGSGALSKLARYSRMLSLKRQRAEKEHFCQYFCVYPIQKTLNRYNKPPITHKKKHITRRKNPFHVVLFGHTQHRQHGTHYSIEKRHHAIHCGQKQAVKQYIIETQLFYYERNFLKNVIKPNRVKMTECRLKTILKK